LKEIGVLEPYKSMETKPKQHEMITGRENFRNQSYFNTEGMTLSRENWRKQNRQNSIVLWLPGSLPQYESDSILR